MFGNESFIMIFFRLANFVALIGVGLYLFKKYGLPATIVIMDEQNEADERLNHRLADVEAEHKVMAHILHEDAVLCETLKVRVREWKKKSDENATSRDKNYAVRMADLQQKMIQRAQLREQEHVQETVATQVVGDLYQSMPQYFEHVDTGSEYLASIIQFMKKEES